MQAAHAIGHRAGWDTAQRVTRGCDAFRGQAWQAHIRTQTRHTETTAHAVVPACTEQHEMPMAGGARHCRLLIDAVCATAVAAATTICEGISIARDKPVVAASM